ncbi:MAG: ubiquinone/menaquinone biosynthesis methyltransferase [Acidobacteriota bacterium]|nr:ubiquinone/menaquinone biosynthesis methyltransferase [Acidobacteriota bacterium]
MQTHPKIEAAAGARPAGIVDPHAAATSIRQMFDTIAPTYDRANHLLSFGIDRYWWARAAWTLRAVLRRPDAVVLDLCCGTGDMTLALDRYRPRRAQGSGASPAPILAADFSHCMLALGARKFAGRRIVPVEADGLHLPLADSSVDLVTAAFGFRNLADYAAGLRELHRVLRPGGQLGILECNQPEGAIGALYSLYFQRVLPVLGGLVSREPRAYAYLPDSVVRFPRPPRMKQLLAEAGFAHARWSSYTFGTAGLYRATRL